MLGLMQKLAGKRNRPQPRPMSGAMGVGQSANSGGLQGLMRQLMMKKRQKPSNPMRQGGANTESGNDPNNAY